MNDRSQFTVGGVPASEYFNTLETKIKRLERSSTTTSITLLILAISQIILGLNQWLGN